MHTIPLVVFLVALAVSLWTTHRAQSLNGREQLRWRALGTGALCTAGVVGTVLQPGGLRFAWAALAVAGAVTLAWLAWRMRGEARAETSEP